MNTDLILELKSFADYYESVGNYHKADNIDELIRTAASKPWYKNPATYLSALGLMAAPSVIKQTTQDIKAQSPATGLSYNTPESFNADVDKFNRIKDKENQQEEFEYIAQQKQPQKEKASKPQTLKSKPQTIKTKRKAPSKPIEKGNFDSAINKMLNLEGGKTYEKADRGGKTNYGITQRTYNSWKDSLKQPRKDVFTITVEEAKQIYKKNYWDLIKGSQLPHDVAQAILSMALTDGPQDSIKYTQKMLGIPPTGVMGPITVKAIWSAAKQKGSKKLTNYIVDKQIQRYQSDEQAETYGRGWTNRAESLRPK
jgi:hypothetical protein